MRPVDDGQRDELWKRQDMEFRDPTEVVGYPAAVLETDPRLFEHETHGPWWEVIGSLGITLLVTREYEHLIMGFRADPRTGPHVSALKMPHPSGIAVDRDKGIVHIASTRNPNQIFDLEPAADLLPRTDARPAGLADGPVLMPVRSRFLPGCCYLHDLAMVGGGLHGNSVGQNAVVSIADSGRFSRVWWPRCIETADGPLFSCNHLQLNSIAAGPDIERSYFSASTEEVTELRPGNPDFPVDRRGVIFSGATREPIVRGLTRPHSARLYEDRVWVDNSGYGEVGVAVGGSFETVTRLPGWTRGLCFCDGILFAGSSRVLPRFRSYAPGLDVDSSRCGIHAVEVNTGRVLASLLWPYGSQVFAVEWIPSGDAAGLPFRVPDEMIESRARALFYAYHVHRDEEE